MLREWKRKKSLINIKKFTLLNFTLRIILKLLTSPFFFSQHFLFLTSISFFVIVLLLFSKCFPYKNHFSAWVNFSKNHQLHLNVFHSTIDQSNLRCVLNTNVKCFSDSRSIVGQTCDNFFPIILVHVNLIWRHKQNNSMIQK